MPAPGLDTGTVALSAVPATAASLAVFAPSPLVTVTFEKGDGNPEIHFHAGGQGIWVARLAGALGARVTLATTLGGESGRVCEVCHNEYDKTIDVIVDGQAHVFDSFECAIHALAPNCVHCDCRIIGHGVETDNAFYCCAHCAHAAGADSIRDRA